MIAPPLLIECESSFSNAGTDLGRNLIFSYNIEDYFTKKIYIHTFSTYANLGLAERTREDGSMN